MGKGQSVSNIILDEWVPVQQALDSLLAAGFVAKRDFANGAQWVAFSRQGQSGRIRVTSKGVDNISVKRAIRRKKCSK